MDKCSECNGNGTVECIQCYGSGRHGSDPTKSCSHCGGSKRQKCWKCNGTGRRS
jgi:hypothetical protein